MITLSQPQAQPTLTEWRLIGLLAFAEDRVIVLRVAFGYEDANGNFVRVRVEDLRYEGPDFTRVVQSAPALGNARNQLEAFLTGEATRFAGTQS